MSGEQSDFDRLLKARAAIDDELRRQKSLRTVLFTDVVAGTARERFFPRQLRLAEDCSLAVPCRDAGIAALILA